MVKSGATKPLLCFSFPPSGGQCSQIPILLNSRHYCTEVMDGIHILPIIACQKVSFISQVRESFDSAAIRHGCVIALEHFPQHLGYFQDRRKGWGI